MKIADLKPNDKVLALEKSMRTGIPSVYILSIAAVGKPEFQKVGNTYASVCQFTMDFQVNRWLSDYIGQGDLDEIDFKKYI